MNKKGKRSAGARSHPTDPVVSPELVIRLAAAVAVAGLAFLFFTGQPQEALFSTTILLRGALAGVAAGLLFSRREWTYAAAVSVAGALASSIALLIAGSSVPLGVTALGAILVPGALAGLVAYFVPRTPQWPRMLVVVLALTVAVGWSLGLVGGPMKRTLDQTRIDVSSVPQPEQYRFDPVIFIKTVDYMRAGVPYYQAFQRAWSEDARLSGQIPSALNFREPLLFEFWRYLPGSPAGTSILNSFLVFAWVGVMVCWLTARRFVSDGVAMLAGQLMLPIYVWAAFGGLGFAMVELWASVLIVSALALLVRRRYLLSALVIFLAVAVRELSIIYVPAWVIAWYFSAERKRWLPGLVVALAGPLAVLGVHITVAPASHATTGSSLRSWMHSTGLSRTLAAVRFGGESPFSDWVMPAAAIASVAGAALVEEAWLRWALLYVALAPLLFLTAFSGNGADLYWGLTFQPTFVVLAVLVFVRVFPSEATFASAGGSAV